MMVNEILIRWIVAGVLAAAFGAFCWVKGDEHGSQKLVDYTNAQLKESARITQARLDALTRVEIKYVMQTKRIIQKGEIIEKEVPVYVTTIDDSHCVVPVGFVRIYNAAVANSGDPGTVTESDRADSGVSLSTVAEADAFNLKIGHLWRSLAKQCIESYNAVRNAQ